METWRYEGMVNWTWRQGHGDMELKYWGTLMLYKKSNRKREPQAIFFNQFTFCSLCKRKLVVCSFVDQETNGSYPFANGLNRLNRLTHLWSPVYLRRVFGSHSSEEVWKATKK
jgi:hypothetical protein